MEGAWRMPSLCWGLCAFALTPLQSKFVASMFATTMLVLVLLSSFPGTAYSFDGSASVRLGIPLNGQFESVLDGGSCSSIGGEDGDGGGGGSGVCDWEKEHEGSSFGADGLVVKRDTEPTRSLGNGIPGRYNLQSGDINYWLLDSSELFDGGLNVRDELRRRDGDAEHVKRQPSVELYITFNTCLQPQPNAALPSAQRPTGPPPALELFMSNSSDNKTPGPAATTKSQTTIPIVGGFGSLTINATGAIWVSVYAPRFSNINQWQDIWNYELVLSTTKPYHGYVDDQFLYLVDTDNSAALFITGNMSTTAATEGGIDEDTNGDDLLTRPPPYTIYAQNTGVASRFSGLENSYCAVTKLAQVRPSSLDSSMTSRGLGNLPKEQFHLRELNRSSTYLAFLARPGSNSSNDTSGTLWRALNVSTKKDGNCQIIYNLPFCSEVAYAVPSNPTQFSMEQLTTFYDDIAAGWHKNFSYSLQQINCNVSKVSAYSIARGCTDCDNAYRNWLCAVTIPRCMDWSSPLPYLADRAATELFYNGTSAALQSHAYTPALTPVQVTEHSATVGNMTEKVLSRNKDIDTVVRPGPYKEIKPCLDLCWTLVQSCPSSFGFACPKLGSWAAQLSYGEREGGDVTCSYLGAVYFQSSASKWSTGWWGGGGSGGIVWSVGVVVVIWSLVWECL